MAISFLAENTHPKWRVINEDSTKLELMYGYFCI